MNTSGAQAVDAGRGKIASPSHSAKLKTFNVWGTNRGDPATVHLIDGEFRAHSPAGAILQYLKSVSVFGCPFDLIEAKPVITRVVRV